MGLCFSLFSLSAGTRRVGGGEPICSRAAERTALAAEKRFFFGLRGTAPSVGQQCRLCTNQSMALEERDFYDEKEEKKAATLNCPHCKQSADYELSWLVRTKKRQLPARADERDRAKFAKARSYMVRKDDLVMCKNMRCRKRIEVSGVQSVAFLD